MNNALNPNFAKIKLLIDSGLYNKALSALELLERSTKESNDILESKLSRILIYNKSRRFEEALSLLISLQEEFKGQISSLQLISVLTEKHAALRGVGQINDSLTELKKAELLIDDLSENENEEKVLIELNSKKIRFLSVKGVYYGWYAGDFRKALVYFFECMNLTKLLNNDSVLASINLNIGVCYKSLNEYNTSLEYFDQALLLNEKINNKLNMAKVLNQIGELYRTTGEIDLALIYHLRSYDLLIGSENYHVIAYTLVSIAKVHLDKGNLNDALLSAEKSLKYYYKINNQRGEAESLTIISKIHLLRGTIDKALEYRLMALDIFKKHGSPFFLTLNLQELSNIYLKKGDYQKAKKYLDMALSNSRKNNNKDSSAWSLYYLIRLISWFDIDEDSNSLLQELELLSQEIENRDNKTLNLLYRLSKAIIMKKSSRMRDQGKAQSIFKKIGENSQVKFDLRIDSLIFFAETLVKELDITYDETLLDELQTVAIQLRSISKEQNSSSLLAESYLLESKLSLVSLDLDRARSLLHEAQMIADDRGLHLLAKRLSYEHDKIVSSLDQWLNLKDKGSSMQNRLKMAKLAESLLEFKNKDFNVTIDMKYEPSFLVITNISGISVFSQKFQSSSMLPDQLISGFLSAINSLGREILDTSSSLDRISYGDHTIVVRVKEPFLFAYAFKGETYKATRKIEEYINSCKGDDDIWEQMESSSNEGRNLSTNFRRKLEDIGEKIFQLV